MDSLLEWFRDPAHTAFAAFALSLIAIVVSITAWITSWRTQKRHLAIEEARDRDRVTQRRKANLTAQLLKEPRPGHPAFFLEVRNDGPAEARDISVTLDDQPFLEHPVSPDNLEAIHQLGSAAHFRYPLVVAMGQAGPYKLHITWSDDSGEAGSYLTTLTV